MFAADLVRMLILQLGWVCVALLSAHFPTPMPWPPVLALIWGLGAVGLHTVAWGHYARRVRSEHPLVRTATLAFVTAFCASYAFVDLLEWIREAFPEKVPPMMYAEIPRPYWEYTDLLPQVALYCIVATSVACICGFAGLEMWGAVSRERAEDLLRLGQRSRAQHGSS
jgi:hypothetical protein